MLWWAFQANLSVFLAWALGREVDPDDNATALLAAPLSLGVFVWQGSFDWLVIVLLLMLLRVGNHICGKSPKPADGLLLLGLCAYLCWQGHYLLGFTAALVFLADARLSMPNDKSLWYALLALLLGILGIFFSVNDLYSFSFEWPWLAGVAALSLLFFLVISHYRRPRSSEDYRVRPLNGQRMQITLLIILLTAFLVYLLRGQEGLFRLFSLWSVILSAVLLSLYRALSGRSAV
jgi:hypothetical protein